MFPHVFSLAKIDKPFDADAAKNAVHVASAPALCNTIFGQSVVVAIDVLRQALWDETHCGECRFVM